MSEFQMAMLALKSLAASLEAVAAWKAVYAKAREQAQRTNELTPAESKQLDDKALEIEASVAQQPSGR